MNSFENICLCALNNIFGYEPRIAFALIENLGSASEVFSLSQEQKDQLLGSYSKYRGRLTQKEIDTAALMLKRAEEA